LIVDVLNPTTSRLVWAWGAIRSSAISAFQSECAKQNSPTIVLAITVPRMSTHNPRRRSVQPIVAAVVQPVAKRLSRMEALLIEMRYEQDVQLRRAAALQTQLDTLTELVSETANHRAASHRGERSRGPVPAATRLARTARRQAGSASSDLQEG
jgi:hypothetical protein